MTWNKDILIQNRPSRVVVTKQKIYVSQLSYDERTNVIDSKMRKIVKYEVHNKKITQNEQKIFNCYYHIYFVVILCFQLFRMLKY